MSVLPILCWPDPRLSVVCDAVSSVTAEMQDLADDMLETMYAAPGRGLAAPQVGHLLRLFVMDVTWKEGAPAPQFFFNPVIADASDTMATHSEGCLSIPGVTAEVARPDRVRLTWTDRAGVTDTAWFEGFAAACVQHELDHLNGRVTLDHLEPSVRVRTVEAYEAYKEALT
ncbi:peptide deformylase [uncultured Roseobacter sp.]|uniref:peptide deformylase n=1 Tax=uncultured Roseobacter sp. TaxID=114847 RepID=UPI0026368AF2|nr:peptide deformylase [uncultured Roseobacter sp.]